MTEGLSTTASVIAVTACAAESAKCLFRVFHQAPMIPDNVRQLLSALTSLHTTLNALQQYSANREANPSFPLSFHQSLTECQKQLQVWSTKVAKINAVLQNRDLSHNKWKGKGQRSWQKMKWLAVGEKDMNRFLEIIKLYHAEFSLQLLALLLNLQDSDSAPRIPHQGQNGLAEPEKQHSFTDAISRNRSLSLKGLRSEEEVVQKQAYAGPSKVALKEDLQNSSRLDLAVDPLHKDPVNVQHFDEFKPDRKENLSEHESGSGPETLCITQRRTRTRMTLRVELPFFDCLFRGGPVGMARDKDQQSGTVMLDSAHAGLGFSVCIGMAQLSSKRLSFEFMVLFLSIFRRLAFSLFCNLDCARVVPQDSKIFEAVRAGSTEISLMRRYNIDRVRQMLGSGQASVKDVTTHGLSLLHTASGLGLADLARFLIEAGADVNASDEDGDTPLHRATSRNNNNEVARILVENGADIASAAVGNRTALHNIFNDTIRYILSFPDVVTEIGPDSEGMSVTHYLCWSRHSTPEDLKRGRAHDTVKLWATDGFGRTCLHYAALKGNISLLSHLLGKPSSLELESRDLRGMTSLHCATRSGRAAQVVKMLLAKGANINARDTDSRSLLDHAAIWGRKEALEQFLAASTIRNFVI